MIDGLITTDGIVLELHPNPAYSPTELFSNIHNLRAYFRDNLKGSWLDGIAILPASVEVVGGGLSKLAVTSRPWNNIYLDNSLEHLEPWDKCNEFFPRTAGGHIHFGATGTNIPVLQSMIVPCIAMLDLIVGTMTVSGRNSNRRKFYGKAGTYRLQPHGFEYRVPSTEDVTLNNLRLAKMTVEFVAHNIADVSDFLLTVSPHNAYEQVANFINKGEIGDRLSTFIMAARKIVMGYKRITYKDIWKDIDEMIHSEDNTP